MSRPSDYRLIITEGWFRSTHPRGLVPIDLELGTHGKRSPRTPRNRKDDSSPGRRSTNVMLVLRRAGHPLAEIDCMQVFEDHKDDLRC